MMNLNHKSYPSLSGDDVPMTIQVVEGTCRCGRKMMLPVPVDQWHSSAHAEYLEETMRCFADFCQEQTGRDLLREWNRSLMLKMADAAGVELLCREAEKGE